MVLSPQAFHNVNVTADIFNHCNINFWEYAQHGYDALGFISCTGVFPTPQTDNQMGACGRMNALLITGWDNSRRCSLPAEMGCQLSCVGTLGQACADLCHPSLTSTLILMDAPCAMQMEVPCAMLMGVPCAVQVPTS